MTEEAAAEYRIEPELASPPPRHLRLPLRTRLLFFAAVALFSLFFYGGASLFLQAAKLAWLAVGGTPALAHVTKIDTVPSGDTKRPPIQTGISYTFEKPFPHDVPAQVEYSRLNLGEVPYDIQDYLHKKREGAFAVPVFHIGDPLLFRYAVWMHHPLLHPWSRPPFAKIAAMASMGLVVLAVGVVVLRRLLTWQKTGLYLMRHGIATSGTILHKRADTQETPRYYVLYGFGLEASDDVRQREERCTLDQWKKFEVGQTVTVLYDRDNPVSAALYALL